MRHQLVLTAAVALSACGSGGPSPPNPPPASVALPAPGGPSFPSYDLRVSALPVRPAGAALAAAGVEHALVRQDRALPKVTAPARPRPVRSPPSKAALGETGLPARVLEVHAAYRRWCAAAALPGDEVLLASAGGLRLAGAIGCERSSAARRPTRLFPDPG